MTDQYVAAIGPYALKTIPVVAHNVPVAVAQKSAEMPSNGAGGSSWIVVGVDEMDCQGILQMAG